MIHDFLFISIVVGKCEEWKEEALLWSAPSNINIATPLQKRRRWDITLLVQSVNLICAKMSIALIGLYIFFFASQPESRATF